MSSLPPDRDGESVPPREVLDHPVCRAKKAQPKQKVPLAALLEEHGCFACLDEARRWIMAGKVLVNNHRFDKPGMLVPRDAVIRIRGRSRSASRAGYKLEAALEHFAVDVVGRITLDCGASAGGFTDCLLQHGAALVYAVDVGYGQLIGRLRLDSRVRNLEQTHLSSVTLTRLTPLPSLITLDLSYLSLTRALPVATALLTPEGQILALVKPLVEVANSEARRTGQIEDSTLLVTALQQVIDAGTACSRTRFWSAVITASFEALDACSRGGIFTCATVACCARKCMIRCLMASFPYSQAVEMPAVSATLVKVMGRCSLMSSARAASACLCVISAFICAVVRRPSTLRAHCLI